jgi:RNA polymerase sigma factor (sigma-70 family)
MPRKDYRIEVKVKNNKLLEKIEEAGYETVAAFCRDVGLSQTTVGRFISMKQAPVNKLTGEYVPTFMKMVDFLRCMPEDVFPKAQMRDAMKVNKVTTKADIGDVQSLTTSLRTLALPPEDKIIFEEARAAIQRTMETLTPREQRVLMLRFGFHDGVERTRAEIAEELGFSRTYIDHIEQKALRKMKHPGRSREMRKTMNDILGRDQ